MNHLEIPKRKRREFLPEELKINSWNEIKPYFDSLKNRTITSVKELEQWLKELSELGSILQEDKAWRFINMSTDTLSEEKKNSFNFFVSQIEPRSEEYWNEYRKKILSCEYTKKLDQKKYFIYLRAIKKQLEIFREENLGLLSKTEEEAQKHGEITGKMTVLIEGKELTIQQASNLLKDLNSNKRKKAFIEINKRRAKDRSLLDESFNKLVTMRDETAKNASFKNYRDYKFASLERFDYTPEDCFIFHEAIEKEVMPLLDEIYERRRKELEFKKLKPWDLEVDTHFKEPLKPFHGTNELIDKSIRCFSHIKPYFGDTLKILKTMNHLDLDSRKGKRGGGYNYPLHETGVPFIFMNSVDSQRDLSTMMHEGGHAIHSLLTKDLELLAFKDTPSEVAELASMSMELISMEHWNEFYNDEDLKRARKEQLIDIIESLSWIAAIDSFQHWIYENPTHTTQERTTQWLAIMKRFESEVIDWSEHKEALEIRWQKQLHLFEVPFYYIEYAMAQLGAIAIWKNYKKDKDKTIEQYTSALKLGYTKTIKEIYETAGIKFDFSRVYIRELVNFVKQELEKLY